MKKQRILILFCVLAFTVLFTGCSERLQENRRISNLAKQHAQQWAVEYIAEKYGIQAESLGYDVQGLDIFMAYENTTGVIVAMSYQGEQFCVYLDVDNENVRSDNRQGLEVANVLETYFLEKSGLPHPAYSNLEFWLQWGRYQSTTPVWIGETAYDANRMLNFYYDGQSAVELLEYIETIRYNGGFVQPDLSLENITLTNEAWPTLDDFELSSDLYLLSGDYPIEERMIENLQYDKYTDWGGLREYLGLELSSDNGTPSVERTFCAYQTAELFELTFIGMKPFDPNSCIVSSEEQLVWREREKTKAGMALRKYEQVSPLFYPSYSEDMWEDGIRGPSENPTFRCTVPQSYLEQYGDDLYVGAYWSDTNEIKISKLHDGSFGLSDLGTSPNAPHDAKPTLAKHAILHLKSEVKLEENGPPQNIAKRLGYALHNDVYCRTWDRNVSY